MYVLVILTRSRKLPVKDVASTRLFVKSYLAGGELDDVAQFRPGSTGRSTMRQKADRIYGWEGLLSC